MAQGRTLALPIRVEPDGRLTRADATESLLRLIEKMAASSRGSWRHAPWFGLHEMFVEANPLLQDQQRIADALNLAFGELGVRWARVQSVTSAPSSEFGERRFNITLTTEGGSAVHGSLTV